MSADTIVCRPEATTIPVETLVDYIGRVGYDNYGAALVRDAATVLDERVPGWRALIDPDAFDIEDPSRCVLHYVFGGYSDGLRILFGGAKPPVAYAFAASPTIEHWPAEIAKESK